MAVVWSRAFHEPLRYPNSFPLYKSAWSLSQCSLFLSQALKLDRIEAEAVSPALATASAGALFLQKEQQAATQESSEGNCKAISLAAMTAGGHRPSDQGKLALRHLNVCAQPGRVYSRSGPPTKV